jgi:ABC-type transport system substrate-binding protein
VRRAGPWAAALALWAAVVGLLAGCANPGQPPAQPPAPAPPPPPADRTGPGKQLVVAVDDLGTGFNPHLISDQSPLCTEVAALVLPSVFRPDTTGAPQLDTTVATSAKVTSTAPFTVSYELNLAASWSDNAPIAAEDFVYLWQRMRSEPAVVDNAGYRLITDVRSRAGGKAVDVVFAQSYPAWQRLFTDLLPAHLLKDAPIGFATALTDAIPVSGGPFQLTAVDRARGQLVLARNDHYWGVPPVLDTLVLRRTDPAAVLDGLRAGELPLAHLWPDQPTLTALKALGPAARLQPVAQPMVVQLGMRTDQGVMTDERVRQAVGALLNRDALVAVGTADGVGGVRADAQLLAPSEPGYRPTAPAGAPTHPDPGQAAQLLTAAGYTRDGQGRWTLLGGPLRVTVGAPADHPRFQAVAAEVVRQLDAAGVDAQLVTAPGTALFPDATVVPTPPTTSASPSPSAQPIPPVPATPARPERGGHGGPGHGPARGGAAASRPVPAAAPTPTPTGQPATRPPGQPASAASGQPANSSTQPPSGQPSSSSAAAPPTGVLVDLTVMPRAVGADLASTATSNYGCPPGMAGVARPARNPTGFCSTALQPLLDAALSGAVSIDQAAPTIEATLWRQLPAIPLFQPVTTLATTPRGDQVTADVGPGPLTIGPLGAAPRWQPANQ